ncbi:hypothetical protein NESM_000550100 [Novymonas esmeraldas]|uniref:DUF423 domain-containing protein n=1 Tax=Novymonas esmeraldas TaxID=1808958 RepID=A0AAW0ESL9_9TRYP
MVSAPLACCGILGLTGVIAGAVGSHALKSRTEEERTNFLIGAQYQLMHSMAALAALAFSQVVAKTNATAARRLHIAACMFLVGTTLFSGTIYARTFGASKAIRRLAPLGGYIMMGGWGFVVAAAAVL